MLLMANGNTEGPQDRRAVVVQAARRACRDAGDSEQ